MVGRVHELVNVLHVRVSQVLGWRGYVRAPRSHGSHAEAVSLHIWMPPSHQVQGSLSGHDPSSASVAMAGYHMRVHLTTAAHVHDMSRGSHQDEKPVRVVPACKQHDVFRWEVAVTPRGYVVVPLKCRIGLGLYVVVDIH